MKDRFIQFTSDITRIYKDVQRIKNREMQEIGLKGMHLFCLFYLQDSTDGLTLTELSRLCGEDKAAMSRMIADLLSKGYVMNEEAKKGSRYRAKIQLTELGNQAADKVEDIIERAFTSCGLSTQERNTFYQSFQKLANNIDDYCNREENE